MNLKKSKKEKQVVHLNVQEYLSPDILDEDYIKIFAPYRMLQKMLGSCRVDVRDRFVTAPSIFQKCYTIISFIYIIFASATVLQNFENRSFIDHRVILFWIGGIAVLIAVFIINVMHTRFFNNESNVKLFIKMQEIDRLMKLNHNKINSLHFKRNLRATVALGIAVVAIGLGTILLTRDSYKFYELLGPIWGLSTFVFELSCCSSYIALFGSRVRLINSIIINHFKLTEKNEKKECTSSSRKILDIAAVWSDFETSDTDVYLKHIFHAYLYFQGQYKFQILLLCSVFAAWTLFIVEYGLLAMQRTIILRLVLLDFMQLMAVHLILLLLLMMVCFRSESLSREVKKTKKLAIIVMSRYTTGNLRQKAKNMLELIEHTPMTFSVYGMWLMDAQLLLNMFNILTSWLVTLLQFAFL